MTKMLADLLMAKEPLFSTSLRQLEKVAGAPGVDVRLKAEIIQKFHRGVRKLGLDPNDSSGEEIYSALMNLVREHDANLAKQIGGTEPDNPVQMVPLIIKAVEKTKMPRSCWVLKHEVASQMLRNMPPPAIMSKLGYEHVDDMLNNEDLFEIYAALRFAEDSQWLNTFIGQYHSVKPNDFEVRDIKIVVLPGDRWSEAAAPFVEKKMHNITHLKELGIVVVLPISLEKLPGLNLVITPLMFHYFNEIRLYSSFFKLQQIKSNFGEIFVDTLIADPGKHAILAGHNIHWRVIQRYYGKLKDEYHPEIFEPHVQPEDLHWRKAEALLARVDPQLAFWKEMDYVAMLYDGRPVTFNLMDLTVSYANDVGYKEHRIYHFREALWNELFARYMGQKILESQILRQLDDVMIAPEKIERGERTDAVL